LHTQRKRTATRSRAPAARRNRGVELMRDSLRVGRGRMHGGGGFFEAPRRRAHFPASRSVLM
jgi:hypothetical protein